jgi:2-polyprenyl-3-methyl-5-hydroxy-6-metoxy-1,4-benzoquinol methylase
MEMHPDEFMVRHLEPAPCHDGRRCAEILARERCHPENEFYGRDYAGSRYHHLAPSLSPGQRILDIACGSGAGTELMSRTASLAVGVDYLDAYVRKARQRYPQSDRLAYLQGDGQTFLFEGKEEQFDTVVSLHTLEHVPDDAAMLANLFRNLRPGGKLVAEVPLLAKRPIGRPINPYHLREYSAEGFLAMLQHQGFVIERVIGVCRGFYGTIDQARDAVQVHAIRPE